MKKIRLAIFDLTDCEGCELQFLALREKLAHEGQHFEIENWRLGTSEHSPGPFDISFIEGSPITESDIELTKQLRKISGKVITLGTCAAYGGLQSALPEKGRESSLKEIYGANYKVKTKAPKPVSYYIDVDIDLPGCPINPVELQRLLSCLFENKKFVPAYAPVCLDCKARKNECLLLSQGFCLGPVTKGGCGAPCPAAGLRCMGCFGPFSGANLEALRRSAPHLTDKEFDQAVGLFWTHTNEYKDLKTKKRSPHAGKNN